jgi:hypothetical protein
MKRLLTVAFVALVSGPASWAQDVATPGPAFERLAYFVGTWTGEGEQKPGPAGGAAGKFAGTMTCTRFDGGFQVVCHVEGTMAGKPYREMAVFGYDAGAKAYTWYDIDNTGMNGLGRGTYREGAWTYVFEMTAKEKPLKMRITLAKKSPTVFVNKGELAVDGQPWVPAVEARFTRKQ